MKIQLLTGFVAAALLVTPALARRGADDPAGHIRGEGAGHASIVLPDSLLQMARRGADDGAGHIRGEGAGHASIIVEELMQFARRGRGADDPAGHIRGEGAGHASIDTGVELMQVARRGADDPAGHQRRCRGCDDGPNHT